MARRDAKWRDDAELQSGGWLQLLQQAVCSGEKWKTQTNAERLKSRQYKAETLVNEYYPWVRSLDPVIGSKLEDAVNYALNQEQYLRAF